MFQSKFADRPHALQRDSVTISLDADSYMVAYGYGSVVFFNYKPDYANLLRLVKEHSVEAVEAPRSDDFAVAVQPDLEEWSSLKPGTDCIVVQQLDLNNLLVISGVLAQTVALEYFEKRVENMLALFTKLNSDLEQHKGKFNMKNSHLFKLVAENNMLLIEILSKIGLLDRSEIPWKFGRYSGVFEQLRDEFELEQRFKGVDFKLNLIQHNTKFFLELLHNQKSDRLEWIIIILIATEIMLTLADKAMRKDSSGKEKEDR
jgi:uncharacterized Rmd1/YagE family protein